MKNLRCLFGKFFECKKRAAVNYVASVFLLCSSVILAISPFSCRMTEEGIEILPGDKTCPVVEKFEVSGNSSFSLSCSEKMLLSSAAVSTSFKVADETGEIEKLGDEIPINSIVYDESGKNVQITLSEQTKVGVSYVFNAVITDTSGNSTEFQQTFTGFNENPAFLIISEIRTKSDAKKLTSDFVEFYCVRAGNTHGLKFCSGSKGENSDYYFPAMDVEKGEYITLHNRTFETEKSVDETGSDLALSSGEESCDGARDLWRGGTEAKIGVSADVVILKNCSTGKIYDGIPFCKSSAEKWGSSRQCEYAELLFSENIWTSGSGVSSAFKSDSATTLMRSISRKNVLEIAEKFSSGEIDFVSSSPENWALTDKSGSGKSVVSGATPGFKNSTNYFTKK